MLVASNSGAGTANVALSTFTSSAIVVYAMQRLKQAKWFPMVQADRARLNRLFSIGAAAIGAMSVEWVWDPGVRSLTGHIPTLWVAIVGLWHWLNHYAMQETIYQATSARAPLAGAISARMAQPIDPPPDPDPERSFLANTAPPLPTSAKSDSK